MTASNGKLKAPPMVYIKGEEMTRVVMQMVLGQWIEPYLDTAQWKTFDLSCKHRDDTDDKVLKDAIAAGAETGSIFKEPTITPTADQAKEMGLKKPQGSPNGKMRAGWNGYTIDRDTIPIPGYAEAAGHNTMGYELPVLFCRHAVGGEYAADFKIVGAGKAVTLFYPEGGGEPIPVSERVLKDKKSALVVYDNPMDNVEQLAHHFFKRSLKAGVVPYVVTKKTVFKWQEDFWKIMKEVYDKHYKKDFVAAGLIAKDSKGAPLNNGDLEHLLSDNAVMQMVGWKKGGFSMVAHNYDGDILTDLESKVYGSPSLISSVLTGVDKNGRAIMEFEASHGTDHGQYVAHLAGKETSHNPLGMVYALRGAIDHSADLALEARKIDTAEAGRIKTFTGLMYDSLCETISEGNGTRDLRGPSGLTTEAFIGTVGKRLGEKVDARSGKGRHVA